MLNAQAIKNLPKNLPKPMRDNFCAMAGLPSHHHYTLLTRHSLRVLSDENGLSGYHLPLTDNGRQLAFELGEWIAGHTNFNLFSLISSPIQRCIDTADLISCGITKNHHSKSSYSISTSNLLVEPGSFVDDPDQVKPVFFNHGPLAFINALLGQRLNGVKHPKQGVMDILTMLLGHIDTRADNDETAKYDTGALLNVAVSHDTLLAVISSVFKQNRFINQSDWPNMMEGALIWFDCDQQVKTLIRRIKAELEQNTERQAQAFKDQLALKQSSTTQTDDLAFDNALAGIQVNFLWRGSLYQHQLSSLSGENIY